MLPLNYLLSRLIYTVLYLISLLPIKVLDAICIAVYYLGWKIVGYRRSVIIQNLTRSFPDKKYKEIENISNSHSRYFFSLFAEWVKSLSQSKKSVCRRICFENTELLDGDENVFLLMGHYGNWESLNILPIYTDKTVYAVYKEQHSFIADYFSHKMRNRFGVKLLESKEAARFILQNQTPAIYIFMADQAPQSLSKLELTFLNQSTLALGGVERLVAKTKGRVLYTEVTPTGKGFYKILFSKIGLETEITKEFFSCLQQTISRLPEYWLWSHRRWKHKFETQ